MSDNLDAAVRALRIETGATMRPLELTGARYARARARIMTALYGRRVPQAEAGLYAMRSALWHAFGLAEYGDCLADKDAALVAALERHSRDLGHRDGARAMSEEACGP